MIERFKNSLVYPQLIIEYRKDSIIKVLLYLLVFIVLMTTRSVIDVVKFDGLSPNFKQEFINNAETTDESCEIINSIYMCDVEENTKIYEDLALSIFMDSYVEFDVERYRELESQYALVVSKGDLYFLFRGMNLVNLPISDLPSDFHNIDFSLQTTDQETFYNQIFDGFDNYIISQKPIWGSMIIGLDFMIGLIMFMIFIFISTWFLKMRFKVIKFKELFVMTIYSSTALYVLLILNNLYNFGLLLIILLIFIAFRQNNALSAEIYKRLNKKP